MSTVVHIGLQKTATTTFQKSIFPMLPNCVHLGDQSGFDELVRSVERDDDSEYPEARWREYLAASVTPGQTLVISREDFSKRPHWHRTGGRLFALLPDARILLCVRNQTTLMPSLYSQHLKGGGYVSFQTWAAKHLKDPNWLTWDRLVERYHELFGRDRLKVMAFEQLQADSDQFVKEVCSYVQPDEALPDVSIPNANKGLSRPSRLIFRGANRLFRKTEKNPRPVLASDTAWRALESALYKVDPTLLKGFSRDSGPRDREFVESLRPRWAASNARLAELTGLPLDEYGYAFPPTRVGRNSREKEGVASRRSAVRFFGSSHSSWRPSAVRSRK